MNTAKAWTITRRTLYTLLIVISLLLCVLLLAVKSQTLSVWLLSNGLARVDTGTPMGLDFSSASGTLERGFTIQGVRLVLPEEGGTLSIETLTMEWDLWALAGGVVHIRNLDLQNAHLNLVPAPDSDDQDATFDAEAALSPLFELPVVLRLDRFALNGLSVSQDDEEMLALNHFHTAGRLDSSALTLTDLQLEMPPLQLSAERWRLDASHQIEADLNWRYPTGSLDVAGELTLEGSLAELQLRHQLTAPLTVASRGVVQTGLQSGDELSFELQHESSVSDPALLEQFGLAETVSGLEAVLETSGTPQDIGIDADVSVAVNDIGAVSLDLRSRYQGERIVVESLSLESPYGLLESDGSVVISPDVSAELGWRYTAASMPALPAGISLDGLSAEGSLNHETGENGPALSRLTLAGLDANLNGHALSMEGAVDLQDFAPSGVDLSVRAGSNRLMVNGSTGDAIDLEWTLEAPSPGELLPGLEGTLNGSGSLTGTPDDLSLASNLDVREIRYLLDDQRLVTLAALNAEGRYENDELEAALTLDSLVVEDGSDQMRVDSIDLNASGSQQSHVVSLNADSSLGSADLRLAGGLDDGTWSGALEQAGIDSLYGNWRLLDSVALEAGESLVSVDRHCWVMSDSEELALCAEASRNQDGLVSGSADLEGLPLTWLTRPDIAAEHLAATGATTVSPPPGLATLLAENEIYMPAGSLIHGRLDASATFSMRPEADSPAFSVNLTPRNLVLGIIQEIDSESTAEETGQTELIEFAVRSQQLEMSLSEEDWRLQTQLGIDRLEDDGLALQGNLEADLGLTDGQSLSGSFGMDFGDISWLESLVPTLRDTGGSLSLSGNLAGNLERPLLETRLAFDDGSFTVPTAGLQVSDARVRVSSDTDNNFTFSGQGSSGEGTVQFDGTLQRPLQPESRSLEMMIAGEGFRVYDQEGARIEVSPDLELAYSGDVLSVTGDIDVPYFDVIAEEVMQVAGTSAVDTSRDVVVYESEAEMNQERESGATSLGIEARLNVSLGEHVRLRAYGLDLYLDGEILLEQAVDAPLLAYGEVSVEEGFYQMYGQRLTAERGQLLFFGNPLNPALEIRAIREVGTTTVGIQINGTLNSMQSRLFSVPTLPEGEVLAMLVTGRSLDNSNAGSEGLDNERMLAAIANLGIKRGQGITDAVQRGLGVDTLEISGGSNLEDSSVGIGKYLTPNLFIRYDVGLFDREAVLSMIYLLTERIRLEVESGVSQSIDLTYTLER